ncbi:hypothetical protein SJI19_10720 [Acerihabitans sp. TG2]|uniref:ArnT family glycosyltransferase n=1 Tax=Acerihabitans sp. TG2 TaxID=3096008 RepID=UPI002B23559F|nr:hypothetical protein [Acerihabitans sp. TG2]MEA9391009.1 hypothetical protein [Acerihabitans sp. TG2]
MKARFYRLFSLAGMFTEPSANSMAQQEKNQFWVHRCTVILFAAYCLLGTFGRFPWKADEPYSFGIVWNMLVNDRWLVPHVGADPFLEKPPLMFWLGALCARWLPWLAPHEAARLAVVLCVALTGWAFCRTSSWLYDETRASAAGSVDTAAQLGPVAWRMLALTLLVGTLGLAEHIHKFTADLGQLAGAALALAALVRACPRSPAAAPIQHQAIRQGVMLGVGVGVALLSKGLLVPGIIGLVCMLCCWLLPAWRQATGRRFYLAAGVAALPFILPWPWSLYQTAPGLFDEWFWVNNVGRFTGGTALGGHDNPLRDRMVSTLVNGAPASLLLLVALPGLAIGMGLGAPGRLRRLLTLAQRHPAYTIIAVYAALFILLLCSSASMRDIYLLPVYPALALLAVPLAQSRGDSSAGVIVHSGPVIWVRGLWNLLVGLLLLVVVITWAQLVQRGEPSLLLMLWPGVAQQFPVPFDLQRQWAALVIALGLIACWWVVIRARAGVGLLLSWTCGLSVVWSVTFSLLMPWLDAARSYQETFTALAGHLAGAHCVATDRLGESELGMLHYVTGRTGIRIYNGWSGQGDGVTKNPQATHCELLLVQEHGVTPPPVPPAHRVEWRGRRPADTNGFTLYRRSPRGE